MTMRVVVSAVATIAICGLVLAGEKWPAEGNPKAAGISTDPTYGVAEPNPVRVGQRGGGPIAEETYLASLRGPKGEPIGFKRRGSCCPFNTPNAMVGGVALLDKYEVTYKGQEKPVIFFLDMYDYEKPLAPVGFTKAK
jgi:hypothetical protein